MSTVGTITKIATEVAGKTVHAVTHPVQTVASATGQARRVAAAVVVGGRTAEAEVEPEAEAPPFPQAPDIPPVEPQEPSTTEPKAASRAAAHAGRGSEPADDWNDEIDDAPDVGTNPATGLPNAQQDDDGPLIDPASTKKVKAESETLRKAADPNKEQ